MTSQRTRETWIFEGGPFNRLWSCSQARPVRNNSYSIDEALDEVKLRWLTGLNDWEVIDDYA
jgi:hypothetical protein